jgi:hypothetical protein
VTSDGLIELLGEILSEVLKEMDSEAQNWIVTEKSSNLSKWVTEEVVKGENWKSMLVP